MKFNYLLKVCAFCLVLSCIVETAFTQEIKVGQKAPDILLTSSGGLLPGSFSLSTLHKDLILLDFWSFTCTSCIMAFPKMEALQKKFDGRIQVLLVNKNTPKETEDFFKKRRKLNRPDLPFVSDARLCTFFPQNFNPWHVWIDRNHIVRYITVDDNATPENVTRFLMGEPLNVTQLSYMPSEERQAINSSYENFAWNSDYFSSLTKYTYSGPRVLNYSGLKMNGKIRFSRSLATALTLLRDALIPRDKIRDFKADNTVVLEVADPQNYLAPKDPNLKDQWYAGHYYNYDLIIPEERRKDLYQFVLDDVEHYFNLSAKIEMRSIECVVLKEAATGVKPGTKGGPSYDSIYMFDPGVIRPYNCIRRMQNMPMSRFDDKMSETVPHFLNLTFVDSTRYSGNIDLEMRDESIDKFDFDAMNADMAKFGLQFVKEYCLRPVIVISEKNK
jgi:thiol-disulfide isomerase/thioredoxin